MDVVVKAVLGALVAVLLHFAARHKQHYYLAGLIPLFPTFALFAHVMFASDGRVHELQGAAKFGLLSLVPYGMYLLIAWQLSARMSPWAALPLALLAWGALAWGAVFLWRQMAL